jgi:hypothetical protein
MSTSIAIAVAVAGGFADAAVGSAHTVLSACPRTLIPMATAQDVRRIALALPRAYEALVRDRVKFRVGRIVFLSISPDEELLGFGFPKEERAALVASEPEKFLMPVRSDERYHWVRVRLAKIDEEELRELIIDSWQMVVPKRVAEAHLGGDHP